MVRLHPDLQTPSLRKDRSSIRPEARPEPLCARHPRRSRICQVIRCPKYRGQREIARHQRPPLLAGVIGGLPCQNFTKFMTRLSPVPGTNICISNYVLHHDPSIFVPEKWLDESYNRERGRYLIPFSFGYRTCIGRNLAMTNILKIVCTLVTLFEFEPLEKKKDVRAISPGIGEMKGDFEVKVRVREGK
ncbi:cytochrome P450 [Aspergillus foveolatus]|uniref:cytochrome P450 n=1 Tax=Aspergillus foveolatus TaxID=210207 RepID=UPI003CCD6EAB